MRCCNVQCVFSFISPTVAYTRICIWDVYWLQLYFVHVCLQLLSSCRFRPTFLWGKSGHFQTIVHVKMGRTNPKWPDGQRFHLPMPDGATMSYDLFDPYKEGHRG